MATLKQQAESLKRVNLKNLVNEILFHSETELILYNQDQLIHGRNNIGNLIGRYTKHTALVAKYGGNIPKEKKEADAPYNFEWSGEFFKAFQVKQSGAGVEITSQVSYLKDIERLGSRNRAQGKLFGLTDENKADFNKSVLLPAIGRRVKQTL